MRTHLSTRLCYGIFSNTPFFLQFVAACKKPPVFCIITEFMAGGSLRKYLHQQEPHSVPIELVLKLALDVARGMSCLHSQGILHRDLKSENILLGADMSVKVADFGISCLESQCRSGKGFTGTYRWMAPEMIKEKHHTRKVDVYSFGILMWEILTSSVPFGEMTPEQAAVAVALKVWFLMLCVHPVFIGGSFLQNIMQTTFIHHLL
jgi:serine/threonine protein kinase